MTNFDENTNEIINTIRQIYSNNLFSNKVVLVTGGSRGIGRAISISYAALGAKVIINYASNEAAATEVANIITEINGTAIISKFNVANTEEVSLAISTLEKDFGNIDILVNNAGISKDGLFMRFKESDWDNVINTNLKGCYNTTKAVISGMMKKRYGKIINISSVIGLTGNAGQTAYAASKSAIFGLTKSLAQELSSRNIQVNSIAPGYVTTDMTSSLNEKLIVEVTKKIPSGKLGIPLDIAKIAIFLASTASDYITGQTIAVDGGMTMY